PFEDGSSIQLWNDDARCEAEIARLAPKDLAGWRAMQGLKRRLRDALRPEGDGDLWLDPAPEREEIERRLRGDAEAHALLFQWSMVEMVERYMDDERMHLAYLGQGVIGTNASPHDPGTASVWFHHASGRMFGMPGTWGYVEGGMGRVSLALAVAASDAGAEIRCGAEVAAVVPGEGVRLESGELIRTGVVVSNADPRRTLALVDPGAVPAAYRERIDRWRLRSPVVKLNAALHRLPTFPAAASGGFKPHRAMIDVTRGLDAAQEAFADAERGVPNIGFAEVYFQTAYDPSVAPQGKHLVSVFAQYAPYDLAEGTWDSRRSEIGRQILDAMAEFAPDVADCVAEYEVLGPPDIERRIGLTGGHIFQGETMPDQMWEHRLTPRTPVAGLYLCGAAPHPAGSVIALNGRNAAMAVLGDTTPA
ncbi:MAG TPA: NAD(P)/FAD-dependent oxidoreductase, partial [Actinomycetes bacterium]|nr:NAD(P)/FAD-dependent oxidoreductase [Actinomycetes bacterium]